MGTLLPEAVLSIEDRNFYNEPGVDPGGVARAAMVDWRAHQSVQGASTITQQLVKMRLVGNEQTLDCYQQARDLRFARTCMCEMQRRGECYVLPEQQVTL